MKIFSLVLVSLIILFFSAAQCLAFRCGSGIVTSGDTKAKVQITCGKPTSKETACENQQVTAKADRYGTVKKVKSKKCSNKVEKWHYNCGDNDFIYILTFEKGILKSEDTEGRGKGKSDCRGK